MPFRSDVTIQRLPVTFFLLLHWFYSRLRSPPAESGCYNRSRIRQSVLFGSAAPAPPVFSYVLYSIDCSRLPVSLRGIPHMLPHWWSRRYPSVKKCLTDPLLVSSDLMFPAVTAVSVRIVAAGHGFIAPPEEILPGRYTVRLSARYGSPHLRVAAGESPGYPASSLPVHPETVPLCAPA